jgi:hypothetical protein
MDKVTLVEYGFHGEEYSLKLEYGFHGVAYSSWSKSR